jgi:lipoyl(octanoyl) transferase
MRILNLGRQPYADIEAAMRAFTATRGPDSDDELWLVEHDPVFTQGVAGRDAHVLAAGAIPVVRTDRGGQVTYHGPGQVVAYPLLDLRRLGIYVKEYVFRIEQAVIDTLGHFGVTGHRVRGAPGIYVRIDDPAGHAKLNLTEDDLLQLETNPALRGLQVGKIAALGIKVSRHCTYHGLALNVAMDLEPYSRINPCGYASLKTVDLSTIGVSAAWQDVAQVLGQKLVTHLQP